MTTHDDDLPTPPVMPKPFGKVHMSKEEVDFAKSQGQTLHDYALQKFRMDVIRNSSDYLWQDGVNQ